MWVIVLYLGLEIIHIGLHFCDSQYLYWRGVQNASSIHYSQITDGAPLSEYLCLFRRVNALLKKRIGLFLRLGHRVVHRASFSYVFQHLFVWSSFMSSPSVRAERTVSTPRDRGVDSTFAVCPNLHCSSSGACLRYRYVAVNITGSLAQTGTITVVFVP